MANSIALAARYLAILDELYKQESKTSKLDAQGVEFVGANVVKYLKASLVGLGDYNRNTGYSVGDATLTWGTMTLSKDRGRKFSIDAMDNDETLDMAFGKLAGEFMRVHVTPEIDAYRFATIASTASISTATPATLSATTVLAAFDAAMVQMDEDEVPADGRILYVSSTVGGYLKSAVTRVLANEKSADRRLQSLDNVEIVSVPQSRFKTSIDLNAGSTPNAGGFTASAGAKDINFLLVHPSAIVAAAKHNNMKVISPENNPDADAWIFGYRIYHDCFVYDNKVDGVYLHNKA